MGRKWISVGVNIVATVLLVLGSLSNVVGFQSMKSSAVIDTPLFSLRIQRATNQKQNIITTQYLGINEKNLLQFPIKNNTTEQLKKTIDILSKMDGKTFERFTEICIQKARQNDTQQDLSHYQIVQALLLLKTNPDAFINFYAIRDNQELPKTALTYCGTHTICVWGPGCLLILIFWSMIVLLDVIGEVIYTILTIVRTTANY